MALVAQVSNQPAGNIDNHVATLQTMTQKLGLPLPRYADSDSQTPCTPFAMAVVVEVDGGDISAIGAPASTKKQAKQLAAMAMLQHPRIQSLCGAVKDLKPTVFGGHAKPDLLVDHISKLNALTQARQLPKPVYTDVCQEGPSHMPLFTVHVACSAFDGSVLAAATGAPGFSRTQAKQNAAMAVLQLFGQGTAPDQAQQRSDPARQLSANPWQAQQLPDQAQQLPDQAQQRSLNIVNGPLITGMPFPLDQRHPI